MASLTCRSESLGAREVHVWQISLVGDSAPHIGKLSPAELVRLERHRGERRDRFAISHGATREILSRYLGCDAPDVPLSCRYGQPPAVPSLRLSLSHTDGLALLAIARRPVGVDVEIAAHAEDEDLELVARATLTAGELDEFSNAPAASRGPLWLRFWVRKEAVLKASGDGLGDRPLCELDVSNDRLDGFEVIEMNAGAGYLAALAVRQPRVRTVMKEWVDEPR